MKVFASLAEDAHQGWVWIKASGIPARSVIRITNISNGLTVYCEALQIDVNFLRRYNKTPRTHITEPEDSIVIGAWYRARLGGIDTLDNLELQITPCNSWLGHFCASIHHPQAVVRQGAWLGGTGLALGLLGLAFGIASVI